MNRYKIILSNQKIYKEIALPVDAKEISIGTQKNCQIRFGKETIFEDFEIGLEQENGNWRVNSNMSVYFIFDGVTKLFSKDLQHGDDLYVKYDSSNQVIFKLRFILDFDYENKLYNCSIDIRDILSIQIGGNSHSGILLKDELIGNDTIQLTKEGGHYFVSDNHSKYGVYINGQRVRGKGEVRDFDFFSIIGYSFYLKYGNLYTDSKNQMIVSGLGILPIAEQNSPFSYPKFNRNTRLISKVNKEKIEIIDPPTLAPPPEKNIVLALLPALAMLGVTVLLRSKMGSGGAFIILSACTMSIGIITSVLGIISGKRNYKKNLRERREKYTAYIENKRVEIKKCRDDERAVLEETFYSLDREIKMVRDFSGDLFNRSPDDEDYLQVRLGIGSLVSLQPINYKKMEKLEPGDDIAILPEQLSDEFRMVSRVPVTVGLAQSNAVGVVGSDERLYSTLKNMVMDVCIRQYYKDTKTLFIVEKKHANLITWVRLLPHVYNDELDVRNIVCDEDSKNTIFEYLYKELSARESEKRKTPHLVIFAFDDMGIKMHPVSHFIKKADEIGATFVFFVAKKELLPSDCRHVLMLSDNEMRGSITPSTDSNQTIDYSYETIDDEVVSEITSRLAPIFCEEVSLNGTLTKNITLFELMQILSVEDIDMDSNWGKSAVEKTMAAPLGVRAGNEKVYLDLHEKYHGPHGLVAGTTGSGKSEILQSYILSMATSFHPYEVSFVIIDFKGGGMVNQFRDLPHLVGAITNIDNREINRSLLSIKAELKKRQSYFALAGVNHIDKYIQKFKAKEVREPLPHLILIVDEFAELKAEQPDFMKELISAARIGRSLGVHLILATQKPSGVVDDQIWSNSKFKLCLKVQNKQDSNEVIKSPLAAEIREPGRAYLQVGNNEIFELFQSAYSGAPAATNSESLMKEYTIAAVSLSGKKQPIFDQKKMKTEENATTQLEAIVSYVADYCKSRSIARLSEICLPPLSGLIDFPAYSEKHKDIALFAEIGFYDDPENQYQGTLKIDISSHNTLIIGTSQYGKTNLLQCILRSVVSRYTPEEVNVYILDFGSMVLTAFDNLTYVGGVVCSSEDEKLKNFIKLILSEMARRKEKLASVGVSSFLSYKEAGYTDLPQILILLDNMTALRELYLMDDDPFLGICREGIAVGINVILANAQTSGLGYKYLSNFTSRLALTCIDPSEYTNLFSQCRERPKDTPGRILVKIEKNCYECQTFLAFPGEKEIDRVRSIRAYVSEQNAQYPSYAIKRIPEIPAALTKIYAEKNYPSSIKDAYSVMVGLDYDRIAPVIFDLNSLGILGITGRAGSGKGNLVRNILQTVDEHKDVAATDVFIIDGISRKLQKCQSLSITKNYTLDVTSIHDTIANIDALLSARHTEIMNGHTDCLDKLPLQLLVVNNGDVFAEISANKDTLTKFKNMQGKFKAMKVCMIFMDIANEAVAFGAPEALKMMKEAKHFVIFDDLANLKITDVAYAVGKTFKKPVEIGDAYYMRGNDLIKIKSVLADETMRDRAKS